VTQRLNIEIKETFKRKDLMVNSNFEKLDIFTLGVKDKDKSEGIRVIKKGNKKLLAEPKSVRGPSDNPIGKNKYFSQLRYFVKACETLGYYFCVERWARKSFRTVFPTFNFHFTFSK